MKRVFPIIFLLGGCMLLTIGVGVIGAAFFFRGTSLPDAFAWQPPINQVNNQALAPGTVLLLLTGADASDALNNALDHTDLENAYALIAYDPNLSDPERIGALLQLATRYAAAKNLVKAASCYQSAALIATLSPEVSDPARMDTYLQVGTGLQTIGANDAARLVTDQAYLVAQYSPALRREPRAHYLQEVADNYSALGVSNLATQARSKAGEAVTEQGESSLAAARAPFAPKPGTLPASNDVDAATKTRIAAAKQLADDLTSSPPKTAKDWPQDSVGQLSDALLAEDDARQAYYDAQIPKAKDPAVLVALWIDKKNWLALKYRIARGAFGYNLAPDWSKDPGSIKDAWSDAWDNLFRLYESQAAALPQATDAALAGQDVVKRELLAERWGWYSTVSESDVRDAMSAATSKLSDAAIPGLRVDTLTRNGKTVYLLVPDDLYGKNEQALPR